MPYSQLTAHEGNGEALTELYGNPDVEVYVVGWSHARGQAEGYAIASHALWGEPWHRLEVDRFACAPGVEMSAETDVAAAALDVVRRQRAVRDEYGHCAIGGFLQLTQITPDAIHSGIVHRWDDRPGEVLGEAA